MIKLLIIDDDEALRAIYETAFRKDGFEVVIASDGTTGIQKAKSEKPDLILLDQVMPDMQGTAVLKSLKSDPETKNIPVALLSNFGQNEIVQESLSQGAIDYILKYQIDPLDLVNKVKNILKEAQSTNQTQQEQQVQ